MARLFAVIRTRGKDWKISQTLEDQNDWEAHAAFMDSLAEEGFVVLAGPLESAGEALIIARADSAEEVEARLEPAPWTRTGMLKTTKIAEWTVRIGAKSITD